MDGCIMVDHDDSVRHVRMKWFFGESARSAHIMLVRSIEPILKAELTVSLEINGNNLVLFISKENKEFLCCRRKKLPFYSAKPLTLSGTGLS